MNAGERDSGTNVKIGIHDIISTTEADGPRVLRKWVGDFHDDLTAAAEGNTNATYSSGFSALSRTSLSFVGHRLTVSC